MLPFPVSEGHSVFILVWVKGTASWAQFHVYFQSVLQSTVAFHCWKDYAFRQRKKAFQKFGRTKVAKRPVESVFSIVDYGHRTMAESQMHMPIGPGQVPMKKAGEICKACCPFGQPWFSHFWYIHGGKRYFNLFSLNK